MYSINAEDEMVNIETLLTGHLGASIPITIGQLMKTNHQTLDEKHLVHLVVKRALFQRDK